MSVKPLRVCYFGTYRANYARNQIMMEGLRRNGVEVVECHESLWHGVEDRVRTASGGWKKPSFWWRVLRTYAKLLWKYQQVDEYDVMVVGYPGQIDVFLGRVLTWARGRPLVWDVLNSLYLITTERGIAQRSPFTVKFIRLVEKWACRLPDMLFLDTPEFVAWFKETHGVEAARFRLIQIGADDRIFRPLIPTPLPLGDGPGMKNDDIFRVIYYGTYIPNNGVEFIVEAARLLKGDSGIQFEMIGEGPEREKALSLAQRYELPNVEFVEWLEREELSEHIAQADLVLGAFGTTKQVTLTNNNKIYEGFAMRKPVVSGSSPAMPKMLHHGEHLYLCERGDPASLAEAIRALRADPELRSKLVANGERVFHEHFDVTHIGARAAGHLRELVGTRGDS